MTHEGERPVHADRHNPAWAVDDELVPRRGPVESLLSRDEALLYSPTIDRASALNRTALEIWALCDGRRTVAAIRRILAARYDVDESAIARFGAC